MINLERQAGENNRLCSSTAVLQKLCNKTNNMYRKSIYDLKTIQKTSSFVT